MKTVTLSFDPDEDRTDMELAMHGKDFALVCWNMDQALHSWLEHRGDFECVVEALVECRHRLHVEMDALGVSLDMLP